MGGFLAAAQREKGCFYLVVDLYELDEDGQRHAEEHVADHHPAAAKVFVDADRRDEPLPRIFIGIH